MPQRHRVVVVGHGVVGHRFVEALRSRAARQRRSGDERVETILRDRVTRVRADGTVQVRT